MTAKGRREFLKSAGAGLIGAAALGRLGETEETKKAPPPDRAAIPPHRALVVPGAHGYTDRPSVRAGEEIVFRISSTVPYRLSIRRLGLAVDDPASDETLHRFPESPARPQAIHPGSYVHVEKGIEAHEPLPALSIECWARPWKLGRRQAVMAQMDDASAEGFGILIAADGALEALFGDGKGPAAASIRAVSAKKVIAGRWHHLALVWDGRECALHIDGEEAGRGSFAGPLIPGGAPLRLGAAGSKGEASFFLDGDIAAPAIHARALSADELRARVRAKGLEPVSGLGILAAWPLSEERGGRVADSSGNARHGTIINHATWMVGGPSFDANVARSGDHDPARDPRRGHGLRLASDDLYDCRWPESHRWRAPEGARPGFHAGWIEYTFEGKEHVQTIPFLVRARKDGPRAPILLLAATNTWRAYNATAFAAPRPELRRVMGTDGLPNSPGDPPAFSFYRAHAAGQGTYQVGLRMPWPAGGPHIRYGDRTDYSHLARAERFLQVWLERSGYEYDMASDQDLHREPEVLEGRKVLVLNGHSEYWSIPMYEAVRKWLARGGNVACLSGNSLFWRVSLDEDETVLECRKVDAPGDQMPPTRRGECWHSQDGLRGGLLAECGYPGWKLVGLATLGWNDQGNPEHFAPFIVESPDHPLFREPVAVGVAKGDPLGQGPGGGLPRANGHEVDVRVSTLRSLLKEPPPPGAIHPDDPPGMTLLAAGRAWPRSAPKFDYWLRPVQSDAPLGGEVIWWERPEGGRVFNAGSIGAGWALHADERLQRLLANVLHRFGVPRPAH